MYSFSKMHLILIFKLKSFENKHQPVFIYEIGPWYRAGF